MTTPFFGDKSITDTSKDFIDSINPLSEKIFSNLGESRSKTTRGAESSAMDSLQRLSAITQHVADIEKAFQLIQKGNQWHDTVPDLLCERDLYALVSAPKVTKHSKGDPETIIGVTIGEDHTITSVTTTEGTQGASAVGTLPVDQAIVERLQKIHDDTVDTYLNQYMVPAKTLLDNIIRVADAATIPGCQNPIRTPTSATIPTPLTPMEKNSTVSLMTSSVTEPPTLGVGEPLTAPVWELVTVAGTRRSTVTTKRLVLTAPRLPATSSTKPLVLTWGACPKTSTVTPLKSRIRTIPAWGI